MIKFKFLENNVYPTVQDLNRAYVTGYIHFHEGRHVDYNPFLNEQMYQRWKDGWRWGNMIHTLSQIEEQNESF